METLIKTHFEKPCSLEQDIVILNTNYPLNTSDFIMKENLV